MSLVTRDDVARGLVALAVRRTPGTALFTGPAALTGAELRDCQHRRQTASPHLPVEELVSAKLAGAGEPAG